MKNGKEVTPQMMRQKITQARVVLDRLHRLDNLILYDLGNPADMDDMRGEILNRMRSLTGAIQEAERALREGKSL